MKLDKFFLVSCFLSVFLALTVHHSYPFFLEDNQSNLSIKLLNYAQLICESVQSENKRLCTVMVNSTSIATTLFSLLKVLRFFEVS